LGILPALPLSLTVRQALQLPARDLSFPVRNLSFVAGQEQP
jgi:hypothetical protein